MASEADGDDDAVLLLVHELPLDMDGDHGRHLAHILPPQHTGGDPPPPYPFRPPPPLQAATSAEPRLSFRGWLGAPRHWDLWVAKLRPIHAHLWRRLGIHDAVLASTFRFRRDAAAILHLASFWCPRTNTFAFPWGEATITLQDIALLAGFPAHGAPVPAPLAPEWRPDEAALNGVRLGFNRGACKKAHHSAWIKHFLTHDHAASPEHEHAAFLALWLTRFVLPGHPESTMRQSLFPIAVRLARGERLALGPTVLASLYRDLRDIKAFLVAAAAAATGNADMLSSLSLYAPLYILQLWMWERFPTLRPGRENPLMDGDPMTARWHDLSRKINPTLIHEALSSADSFLWQPYPPCSMHTTGCWVHGSDLAGNDDLRMLAHCLRPCELVGMDCIEQYLPHRVARQFGLDQDVPGGVPRANQNWAVAWQTYDLEGKNVAFFIPHAEQSRVTTRYTHWWRQLLPHSDIDDVAAPSAPVEWKTSKRKVKKTLAAMEAEEEKEHRLKKARASPVTTSDKKRKLEELYDSKLSNWLTAARNEISVAACGSYQRGSFLPRYDTASDEALLPNVGTTNDDVVLLVPRKQTTSPPAVLPTNDSCISPHIGDRGTFIADIPNETAQVTTTMLQEEKVMIPAYVSPDVTGSPEEGTTVVMELEKEASAASSNPVEITAPVTEENKKKFATEGTSCAAGMMNPPVMGIAVAMEADEHNAVLVEVGRAADEAIEIATQRQVSQQGVDAGAMNYLHIAVTLPEEAHPIHHRNNGGGCSKVSCTMEDYNVAGALSTDAGITACHDSVIEEQRKVPSIEVTGVGGDHQVVEKDNEKKPQEASQIERVESAQDTALTGSSNEGENKTDHPTVVEVATSDSMAAALLGVLEAENTEVMKDLNPAKKCTEDMPMEVAGEEAGLEQASTSTKGTTEEEHKKFYEVDSHTDTEEEHKKFYEVDSHTDTEKPGQAVEVVCAEIDGAKGAENAEVKRDISLGKNDTEDMPIEVAGGEEAVTSSSKGGANMEHKELSEVDHTDIVEPKMHSHNHIEKPDEADAVECAEIDDATRLNERDTVGEKPGVVPEIGKDEIQKDWGLIVGIKDEKLAKVSEVEHAKVEVVNSMMEDNTDNKYEDVGALENSGSGNTCGTVEEDDGRLNEVHNVTAEVEGSDGHGMDIDGHGCVMQEDLQMRYDTSGEVHTKEKFLAGGNLTDEPLSEQETKEEPCLDGEGLPDKDVGVSKEAYKVKQAEGKECKVEMEEEENINDVLRVEKTAEQGKELTVKDIHDHVEEITQAVQVDGQNKSLATVGTEELLEQTSQTQEKEFDKDSVDDSKNSGYGGIPCRSATIQSKPDQMEVYHEDMMQEEHIQNVEPNDQMEPSSDAAAMLVEGVFEHKTLDTHEEATLKLEQDHKIICDYREKTIFEGSHVMDTGVKPASATLDIDEAQAALVIQSQKKNDMDKQLAMEERQDQHIILETNKMDMSKGADIMVCDEHQSNQTSIEINEVKSPKGMLNQEPFNNEEQLAIEERQDLENTAENNKIYMSEDADVLSCSEYQINPSGMVIDEDGSTQRIQRQELLDNEVAIEERIEFTADRSGISLEAYNAGDDGVTTFAVAVDNSDSTHNKEASNMKLPLTADKQHHGVEILNEKRISEDTSMPGSGELNSDATVLDVMAGSREGTPNQCALGAEMEAAAPEKKDQGTADENTKRNLADIDPHECGVKPDEARNTLHGTLLTAQASNIPGIEIASENKQKEASSGNQNITEVEGPESNQIVMKEKDPEEALSPEPKNPVEVKKENLENETEMSVCRDNDEESEKDHISAEVTITPDLEEQSDNGTRLAKESTKSCENLAPNPKNTSCVLKLGKSSIEDVKRTYNTRSMYLKDIKESLGRIRAEPLNRVQTTSTGNYSRHAVQEPISVCKEIRVPLRDSVRDFGRERAAELVLTSPAEETPRWRQEQYALQILEDVQNSRMAEKTRMEMEIRVLKAQIASMERRMMNLDHFAEVKSRSKRH